MPTIAIDFDGVLHSYEKGWQGGIIYGTLVQGAKEALDVLREGYEIVVFTSRDDLENVENWLFKQLGYRVAVTNTKPIALAYIDDRAIRFTNWEDIRKYFV